MIWYCEYRCRDQWALLLTTSKLSKVKYFFPAFCVFLLIFETTYSQSTKEIIDSTKNQVELSREQILENGTEDLESSQLFDDLEKLEESPLDINEATVEELSMIPKIDAITANAIVERRERIGRFDSIDELQSIEEIDEEKFSILETFTRVAHQDSRRDFLQSFTTTYRGRIQQDEQVKQGFISGKYTGSRPKMYNRLTVEDNYHLSSGVLLEKDAGEQSYADHVAGYGAIRNIGFINQIVIGDFTISSGQGVMLWSSSGFYKSSEVIASPKRSNKILKPFISSEENKYFRGAAVQSQLGPLSVINFYSHHSFDASVDSTGTVSSFDESGLHRTESEIAKQKTTAEKILGGKISSEFSFQNLKTKIGVTGYVSTFDNVVESSTPYAFTGSDAHIFGFDYDLRFSRYNLFGEWARSHTNMIGGVTGITASLTKDLSMTILYRNFPADFISLHGNTFGEHGSAQNEEGVYTGIEFKPFSFIKFSTYFDQFRFPGRTYLIPLPSSGHDYLVQTEVKPNSKILLTARYKTETKDDLIITLIDNRESRYVARRTQQNVRLEMNYSISISLNIRVRGEYVDVGYDLYAHNEHGYLFFTDVRMSPFNPLELNFRAVTYQTTSYESRIYEFENDLRGMLSNVGLYGKGVRLYLVAHYVIFEQLELSMKYSRTIQDGVKSIGSGYDEIQGDTQGKMSLQLDVRL